MAMTNDYITRADLDDTLAPILERLEQLAVNLVHLHAKVEQLNEASQNRLYTAIGRTLGGVEQLTANLGHLDAKVEQLDAKMEQLAAKMVANLGHLDTKVEQLNEASQSRLYTAIGRTLGGVEQLTANLGHLDAKADANHTAIMKNLEVLS